MNGFEIRTIYFRQGIGSGFVFLARRRRKIRVQIEYHPAFNKMQRAKTANN